MSTRFRKSERRRSRHWFTIQDERGQSTVEYAIVMVSFICIAVALGLLMEAMENGTFLLHAISAASHNVQVILGGTADVFSY